MLGKIHGNFLIALENVKWLEYQQKHLTQQPYDINPYTNVYELVKKILNIRLVKCRFYRVL